MKRSAEGPLRIVLVLYKIGANKGSEDASGYNFARLLLAGGHDVTLISRRNNIAALAGDPFFTNATLFGVDVPKWLSWWKRGKRGIIPYYYLWQLFVARAVRSILREDGVDVVHNYNFHTDWAPHFLPTGPIPVVWGPICHQPWVPLLFAGESKVKHLLDETAKCAAKNAFWRLNPALRRAIRRTDLILYANDDIAPPYRSSRSVVRQTFGGSAHAQAPARRKGATFTLLHVARQVPIKGAVPAISAFLAFRQAHPDVSVRLSIVGDGPLHEELRSMTSKAGAAHAVNFRRSVPFCEMAEVFSAADVLLYPSLGNQDTVVAEAIAAGLPVICLADTGSALMAGPGAVAVPREGSSQVAHLAQAIASLYMEWLMEPEAFDARRQLALRQSTDEVSWEATTRSIVALYRSLPA